MSAAGEGRSQFIGCAECVAASLRDEYRYGDRRQVRGTELLGAARRMQGVAEQHQAVNAEGGIATGVLGYHL